MAIPMAVVGRGVEEAPLEKFRGVIVAEMELPGEPAEWVLMGRVTVTNLDGSPQNATARMIDVNNNGAVLAMDQPFREIPSDHFSICFYLQAGYVAKHGNERITLEVDTYDGLAERASLIGLKVGGIKFE